MRRLSLVLPLLLLSACWSNQDYIASRGYARAPGYASVPATDPRLASLVHPPMGRFGDDPRALLERWPEPPAGWPAPETTSGRGSQWGVTWPGHLEVMVLNDGSLKMVIRSQEGLDHFLSMYRNLPPGMAADLALDRRSTIHVKREYEAEPPADAPRRSSRPGWRPRMNISMLFTGPTTIVRWSRISDWVERHGSEEQKTAWRDLLREATAAERERERAKAKRRILSTQLRNHGLTTTRSVGAGLAAPIVPDAGKIVSGYNVRTAGHAGKPGLRSHRGIALLVKTSSPAAARDYAARINSSFSAMPRRGDQSDHEWWTKQCGRCAVVLTTAKRVGLNVFHDRRSSAVFVYFSVGGNTPAVDAALQAVARAVLE